MGIMLQTLYSASTKFNSTFKFYLDSIIYDGYNMKHTSREKHFILKGGLYMENQIKKFRKETNMTQQQLANTVGVSSRTIISLEKGQYNPSILLAYKIACLFNTTIEELYYLNKYSKENINEDI